MTAHPPNANVAVTIGATRKITLLALDGTITSLNMNLKASAKVCSMPKGPTTFGPLRICTAAQIFRSARSTNATEISNTSSATPMTITWLEVHANAQAVFGDSPQNFHWKNGKNVWTSSMVYSAAIWVSPRTKIRLHSAIVTLARA